MRTSLQLADELGLLDGTAEQIIDSTPMLDAAATPTRSGWSVTGVRKLIDAVAANAETAGKAL